jgi:serpin B
MLETPEALHIDQVTHVTWFQMDETHTEAAAATAAEIVATSAPFEDETLPVIFRVDHPFLIALRHRPTGTILFLGRVEQVKAG